MKDLLETKLQFILKSMLLQLVEFDDDGGDNGVGDDGDDSPAPRRAAFGSSATSR